MKFKTILLVCLTATILISCGKVQEPFEGMKEVNDTQLFVRTLGSGTSIIVIHGGPGLSHDYFIPHLESLSKNYRLVFYDHRGAGRSSVEVDPSSMDLTNFAQDIESLRMEFELGEVFLLAHSWGSMVAAEYALLFPDNIKGMVLLHPGPFTDEFNQQITQKQARLMDSTFLIKRQEILGSEAYKNKEVKAYDELFKLTFSLTFEDTDQVESLNLNLNDNFLKSQQLLGSFKMSGKNYLNEFSKMSIPSMVLHGANDITAIEADSALANSLNAELSVMQTGHFSFVERNDEFHEVVNAFLENLND